tara:strand:+ start:347 stop:616 length:270 start_codon:yes stop_codon:yes gene_type:complete
MSKIINKIIKSDNNKQSVQVVIALKEDNITIALAQADKKSPSTYNLTYNQLCSLSQVIHTAIDKHYQEYSSCMTLEKTQKIYIDDPIDW